MKEKPAYSEQNVENFIKAAQYIVRLTAQQDVLIELGKIIVNYFGVKWFAFVRQDDNGKLSLQTGTLSNQDQSGFVLTEKVRDIVRDVLNSGFLASEMIVLSEPYSAVFLPLPESARTGTVMVVAHEECNPPSAELLNLYLALAGIAGSTMARISTEQELRMHQGHLEEIVKARTGELKATNVRLGKEVSERKQAEDLLAKQAVQLQERAAQLEETNRELESFSYSVSHDLRAPLRAIDGFSRKLIREYGDKLGEEAGRLIGVIHSNTEKMGALINALLSFSRVQKINMGISEIDMEKLVCEVWDEIREANKGRKLEIRITKILPGYGDRTLIRQVLSNLFSNAVKFTINRKPSIIEMSSYKDNTEVVYCLKDNGTGFDMAYYDKLFGVFQRLHSDTEYEGTGIGLAIVQRIVQRQGGHVWAEAEADKGATFYFTLPLHTR